MAPTKGHRYTPPTTRAPHHSPAESNKSPENFRPTTQPVNTTPVPASRLLPSITLLAAALLPTTNSPAGQLIVLGDSLSKEYQVTFLGIGGAPNAAHIRNWCEILDDRRNDVFDMGSFSTFTDTRLTGHALNWSIPGSLAADWARTLASPAAIPDDLNSQLRSNDARVVIWLGGNDARVKYEDLYNGKSAAPWINSVASDINAVIQFVRSRNPTIPLVVCGVPHLGGTPSKNNAHPYDAIKTTRVTAALDALNLRIHQSATAARAGYADIYSITRDLVTAPRWVTGGFRIEKRESSSGDPAALFLGDGFHPNWPIQAVFAQYILDAFNSLENTRIPRLSNREIVGAVLGQAIDLTLNQWARGYDIADGDRGWADDPDGDGLRNLVEFAFDLDPVRKDRHLLPQPWIENTGANGPRLALSWQPRDPTNSTWARITIQESSDLKSWSNVPPSATFNPGGGVRTVRRYPSPDGRTTLRFSIQLLP